MFTVFIWYLQLGRCIHVNSLETINSLIKIFFKKHYWSSTVLLFIIIYNVNVIYLI